MGDEVLPGHEAGGAAEPTGILKSSESLASMSILIMMVMLFIAILLGTFLRRRNFYYLHEAGAALLFGVFLGLFVHLGTSDPQDEDAYWLRFKKEFFFLFLLPPIIFESGYSMDPKPFFRNFGAICVFAFLGTFVSAMIVGVIVWFAGHIGLAYPLPMLESMLFGSLISATDPVTVLAVFQELKADKNLYAVVFGESVLNDAVAIVLYNSLLVFRTDPVNLATILVAVRTFMIIFVGSFMVGTGLALLSALLFKKGHFRAHGGDDHGAVLEVCLLLMFPYSAYMLAEGLRLSGIVSILFCGIIMSHYTVRNLTDEAQHISLGLFRVLAHLAETFVFIYMGADTFLAGQDWRHIVFTLTAIVACLIARLANVYPGSFLVNLGRRKMKTPAVPRNHQHMMWFSGLRGAIAFALALGAIDDLEDEGHARAMLTATTSIVLLTVLGVGGATSSLLDKFKVRQVDSLSSPARPVRAAAVPAFQLAVGDDGTPLPPGALAASLQSEAEDADLLSPRSASGRADRARQSAREIKAYIQQTSFEDLDRKYLKPFFTIGDRPASSFSGGHVEMSALGDSPGGSTSTAGGGGGGDGGGGGGGGGGGVGEGVAGGSRGGASVESAGLSLHGVDEEMPPTSATTSDDGRDLT